MFEPAFLEQNPGAPNVEVFAGFSESATVIFLFSVAGCHRHTAHVWRPLLQNVRHLFTLVTQSESRFETPNVASSFNAMEMERTCGRDCIQ